MFFWANVPRYGLESFSGRTSIWRIVLDNFNTQQTLLGALLGNFGISSLTKLSEEQGSFLIFYHTHNLFLQYLWDWGVLGLTLIALLVLACVNLAVTGSRSSFIVLASLLIAGIIEPTFSLSLKSYEFLGLLVFFALQSQITRNLDFATGKV